MPLQPGQVESSLVKQVDSRLSIPIIITIVVGNNNDNNKNNNHNDDYKQAAHRVARQVRNRLKEVAIIEPKANECFGSDTITLFLEESTTLSIVVVLNPGQSDWFDSIEKQFWSFCVANSKE